MESIAKNANKDWPGTQSDQAVESDAFSSCPS